MVHRAGDKFNMKFDDLLDEAYGFILPLGTADDYRRVLFATTLMGKRKAHQYNLAEFKVCRIPHRQRCPTKVFKAGSATVMAS